MQGTLKDYGLSQLGLWKKSHHKTVSHLRDECLFGINYELPKEWQTKRDVIYAFVINGIVSYIGETTSGISSRFSGYRYGNPLITDTDNRVKLAITRALVNGYSVDIWVGKPIAHLLLPNGTKLEIPASKPLEERLIAIISPELNVKAIGNRSSNSVEV